MRESPANVIPCRQGRGSAVRVLPSLSACSTVWSFRTFADPARLAPVVMSLPPFRTAPNSGSLPSTGITPRLQYYGPIRHPAGPACPSRGSGCRVHGTDRASRVAPPSTFHACRRHYPGGNQPVVSSLSSRPVGGLPLVIGGSASAISPFRGLLSVHFAFRPAWVAGPPSRLSSPLGRLRRFRLRARLGCRISVAALLPECFNPCRYLHESPWLLPAEATVAGWDSHPQGKRAFPRHTITRRLTRGGCAPPLRSPLKSLPRGVDATGFPPPARCRDGCSPPRCRHPPLVADLAGDLGGNPTFVGASPNIIEPKNGRAPASASCLPRQGSAPPRGDLGSSLRSGKTPLPAVATSPPPSTP